MPNDTQRVIAIGDIHGCAIALSELIRQVEPRPGDTVVTLGDYVNRGPDSRGVIDHLIELRQRCQFVALLGNHDEVLLDVIDGRVDREQLLSMGGQATLDSYAPRGEIGDIPAEHIEFLRSCRTWFETDSHLFAHANYDPVRPLDATDWNTLVWRKLEEPYPAPHYSGKRVVVGHTAQRNFQVLDLGHVICLDTSCCCGGPLTALDVGTGDVFQAHEPTSRTPRPSQIGSGGDSIA